MWPQIADGRRKRIERMQRLAELVERQRLNVILDVRALDGSIVRIRLGERASCEGAIDIGPLRVSAYCRPMNSLLHQRAESGSAYARHRPYTPCAIADDLGDSRRQPPRRFFTTSMPSRSSRATLPMPDSSRICGEFTAPALRITSGRAFADVIDIAAATLDADAARVHEALRVRAGDRGEIRALHRFARKAFAAFQRIPPRWFTNSRRLCCRRN